MPGKILGLDINEDYVTAVQVVSGFKGFRIIACAHSPVDKEMGIEGALSSISDKINIKNDICIGCLPSNDLFFRNLRMPFKDKNKISQILPFEIETLGAFQTEDIVVDFSLRNLPEQNEILAVSAKKDSISHYLAKLNDNGFNPDVLDVRCVPTVSRLFKYDGIHGNGIFLDLGLKFCTLILFIEKRIALIRSLTVNGSYNSESLTPETIESLLKSYLSPVSQTLHFFCWQRNMNFDPEKIYYTGTLAQYPASGEILAKYLGSPAEQINLRWDKKIQIDPDVLNTWNPVLMDNALALAIRDAKDASVFNLRKDDFEVRKRHQGLRKELKRIFISILLVLLFLCVDMGVDFYFINQRYNLLMQKSKDLFRQTFPDVERIVDPVHQMKIKLNEIKKETTLLPSIKIEQKTLDLLMDISQRISKSHDILVTGMIIDPELIRISGETDSFNTVDSIKGELEPSAYFNNVIISSAKLDRDGEKVQFEMKLDRAR